MCHLVLWCVSVCIYVCQDEEEDGDVLNPDTHVSANMCVRVCKS